MVRGLVWRSEVCLACLGRSRVLLQPVVDRRQPRGLGAGYLHLMLWTYTNKTHYQVEDDYTRLLSYRYSRLAVKRFVAMSRQRRATLPPYGSFQWTTSKWEFPSSPRYEYDVTSVPLSSFTVGPKPPPWKREPVFVSNMIRS